MGFTVQAARRLPPTVLTSSSSDRTVPWYESAEQYWMLRDCGTPVKHLMYDQVGDGAGWAVCLPACLHVCAVYMCVCVCMRHTAAGRRCAMCAIVCAVTWVCSCSMC
jgi:hypothetical protein